MTDAVTSGPLEAGHRIHPATPVTDPFDLDEGARDLHDALRQIQEELTEGQGPLDFGRQGAAELLKTNTRLVREIGIRAIRIARLHQLDYVSRTHVQAATNELIGAGAREQRTGWVTAGGLLLGAGVPELINFVFAEPAPPRLRVVLMIVCMVAGACLLTYGLRRQR